MDELGLAILIVFIGTYLVLSSEKVNRTGTALLGLACVGIVFYVAGILTHPDAVDFAELIHHIEWDTILFVTSMSIIVAVAGASGMFQYIALRLARPSGGNHKQLFITFLVFVFGISLFFDTVSTMLIMAPLTIEVCKALEIDFKPYLIAESITCNTSSIPSIVGAVPNLVIADKTNLDPGTLFLVFMPLSIILFLVTLPVYLKYYDKSFGQSDSYRVEAVFDIDPVHMVKSSRDFYASLVAIIILVIDFGLGPTFGIAPALIALAVAAFMLILSHDRAAEFLGEVGWDTVFFLVGLFGLVGALVLTGLIDELAAGIEVVIGDNAVLATVFMVWVPAMLSAFLDNLPVSLVLAPIAVNPTLLAVTPILPFALVFAVNIGGYIFTPLGSPANMIAIGYSEKEHHPIPFFEFAKIGTILGMIHLTIGTIWLLGLGFLGMTFLLLIFAAIMSVILGIFALRKFVLEKE